MKRWIWLVLGLGLGMQGCSNSGVNEPLPSPSTPRVGLERSSLRSVGDCQDYRRVLGETLTRQYLEGGWFRVMPLAVDLAVAESSTVSEGEILAPDRITETNLQEQSVDEPDLVKTLKDGTLLVLQNQQLHIVRSLPAAELGFQAQLSLGMEAEKLLVDEDQQRAVILGSASGTAGTEVLFVDLQEPTAPHLTQRWLLEGWLLDARRRFADQRVHLALQVSGVEPAELQNNLLLQKRIQEYYEARQNNVDSQELEAKAEAIGYLVQELLASVPIQNLLPQAWQSRDTEYEDWSLLDCEAIAHPDLTLSAPGMTLLLSTNFDGSQPEASAILNNAWQLYASADHLFLLQGSSGWWWDPSQADQTAIWQFDWQEGHPRYEGAGLVDGQVADSFSLSEFDGHLRVATTERLATNPSEEDVAVDLVIRPQDTQNHLFVLQLAQADTPQLQQVGQVRDLAPGESIQSARFLGDRGFVVTFRQVDPLFAFDLKDPQNPIVAGELKIPGFSTYLHPVEETHLLTVGPAGDDEGLTGEWQVQLFDVQDLSEPKKVSGLVPTALQQVRAYSEADWDHHAFLYDPLSRLLAVPVQGWKSEAATQVGGFALVQLSEDKQELQEAGWIEHHLGTLGEDCKTDVGADIAVACELSLSPRPRRTVLLSAGGVEYLYTFSSTGIQVHRTTDFTQPVAELLYP